MQKTNKGACTKRWLKFKKSRDISSFNLQNDKIDLTFFANQAEMRKLPPRRNYFLSFSIKANKVALSEEDLDWLKDWSFDKTSYDEVVNKKVINVLDHNLIQDVEWFKDRQPSTENLVVFIWEQIVSEIVLPAKLFCVKLRETGTIFTEYYGDE